MPFKCYLISLCKYLLVIKRARILKLQNRKTVYQLVSISSLTVFMLYKQITINAQLTCGDVNELKCNYCDSSDPQSVISENNIFSIVTPLVIFSLSNLIYH